MRKFDINKEKFLELFNQGLSCEKIANEFGISRSLSQKKKKEFNLQRDNSFYKKKLFNENFFNKIDTEEKAYWLGFIFADGCVIERGNSRIIKIAVLDKEICDKFLKSINANFDTKTYLEKILPDSERKEEVHHVELFSKQMYKDLYELGCVPRKSLILKFPPIEKEFIRHFIRGYFDGDGCITIRKRDGSAKYNSVTISFCGTLEFLSELNKNLSVNCNLRKDNRRPTNTYVLTKSGSNNCKLLFNYLYSDSTIFLNRKYEKFIVYLSDRNINTKDVQRA